MPTTWKTRERRTRKEHRRELRTRQTTPANLRRIYRVTPEIIAIPDWAQEQRVADFDPSSEYVWLKSRTLAYLLAGMDREEGGRPEVTRVEARRCRMCGMLRLNLMAQHRRKLDESATDGRKMPCGGECLTRYHQRKERN